MSGEGPSTSEQPVIFRTAPPSKFDKFKYYNTLTGLVRALVNKYTIIDLRNESYVSGKIESVDGNMNIEMSDAVLCDQRGNQYAFKSFFISCRNIRYVHIPKNLKSIELIEKQISAMGIRHTKKPAHTFKKVRAERKQKETVLSIYDQRKKAKEEN